MSTLRQTIQIDKKKAKYFVGRIGPETTNLTLRNYFGSFGVIHIAKVEISKRSGKKKGFGYIIFEQLNDVSGLCSKEHLLDGKLVYVGLYEEKILTHWHQMRENSFKLKITEIPPYFSELQVVRQIEKFGLVLISNCPRQSKKLAYFCNLEICRTDSALYFLKRVELCNKEEGLLPISITLAQLEQSVINLEKEPSYKSFSAGENDCFLVSSKPKEARESNRLVTINFGKDSPRFAPSKHSKYEFFRHENLAQRKAYFGIVNYRFNISKPSSLTVVDLTGNYRRKSTEAGSVLVRDTISRLKPVFRRSQV